MMSSETRMDDRPITFVFGSARGGTTYLTEFLDEWFDFGMGPEGTFIRPLYRKRNRYGDLGDTRKARALAQDISRSEMMTIMRTVWPENERIDVTPDAILDNTLDHSFAGIVSGAFAAVAKLRGKTNIGSKDPSFWAYWSILNELFGKRARYILLVRDGRDVALSLFKMPWGEKSAYLAARRWVDYLQVIDEMYSAIPNDQLHLIRYEDFLTQPEHAVDFLERATAVRLTTETRDAAVEAIRSNHYAGNFNKWKTRMTESDAAVFDGVAHRWLERYGYDLCGQQRHPGLLEQAGIHGRDIWRKALLTLGAGKDG